MDEGFAQLTLAAWDGRVSICGTLVASRRAVTPSGEQGRVKGVVMKVKPMGMLLMMPA